MEFCKLLEGVLWCSRAGSPCIPGTASPDNSFGPSMFIEHHIHVPYVGTIAMNDGTGE